MEYNLTDKIFEQETNNGIVIIDFWAEWCGPCRMQAPILKQLSEEFSEEKLKICKINVDENQKTPLKYNIMSIPTLMFKKEGEIVKTVVGVHTKAQIKEILNSL